VPKGDRVTDNAGPGVPAPDGGELLDYARPSGVESSFAPRPDESGAYTAPPPFVSPEARAQFGRPPGAEAFAPLAGERMPPRHLPPPPVSPADRAAFAPPNGAVDGFAPAPGTRINPRHDGPGSPWWSPNALRDPWRDPTSPFWLGRGAIFYRGRPAQVDPAIDEETDAVSAPDADEFDDVAPPEDLIETGPRERAARLGWRGVVIGVVIALLAGALGGGIGYFLTNRADTLIHRPGLSLGKTGTPANRPPGSVADIAKRVGPAVVSIAVTTADSYAVGSGVVIDRNGYVLTNNHVVSSAKGGGTIVVTFSDEATAKATIVGLDPVSDLAVLKVPPAVGLTVAALGDSTTLQVGDPVIAIGSPLGLEGTVTSGIVSALDRAVHVPAQDGNSDTYLDAIQTDAAINPGNSGGALVAADGSVVGINSAVAAQQLGGSTGSAIANGIGYAIPINQARDVAQQLIHSGKAAHASMGAQGRTATDGLREGAYLVQVVPGGPAAKAGLQAGDIIVVAQGKLIVSYDQLAVLVQQAKPGSQLNVTYFRNNAKRTATITLGTL
jgi:S1-C subfamily serine protease